MAATRALYMLLAASACVVVPTRAADEPRVCWFAQPRDHFSFAEQATFNQRYLVFGADTCAPNTSHVLMYLGNEGDITSFASNSGFLVQLGTQLGAAVVFAEHRYFGATTPQPNEQVLQAKKQLALQRWTWLSSAQALADFAALASSFGKPVIAAGGSYGAMLATWARVRYPDIFIAAYASSAPLLTASHAATTIDPVLSTRLYDVVSNAMDDACRTNVHAAFASVASSFFQDRVRIEQLFSLCDPLEQGNASSFLGSVQASIVSIATSNYPYATDFMAHSLPSWPLNTTCTRINQLAAEGADALGILRAVVNLTWPSDTCTSLLAPHAYEPGFIPGAWTFERCSEIIIPSAVAESNSSAFLPCSSLELNCNSPTALDMFCQANYETLPQASALDIQYGLVDLERYNKIVFTNGKLDPWSSGGLPSKVTDKYASLWMWGAAHHLDLRAPNAADPLSVTKTRELIGHLLSKWMIN